MPKSIVIANVEIQLADGLQSGIPPVLFRTVPPISFPSNLEVDYSGYLTVNPGGSRSIITNPPEQSFVYVRNAGGAGLALISVIWLNSPTQESVIPLSPGGVFLYANNTTVNPQNPTVTNLVQSLSVSVQGSQPVTLEYLVAS